MSSNPPKGKGSERIVPSRGTGSNHKPILFGDADIDEKSDLRSLNVQPGASLKADQRDYLDELSKKKPQDAKAEVIENIETLRATVGKLQADNPPNAAHQKILEKVNHYSKSVFNEMARSEENRKSLDYMPIDIIQEIARGIPHVLEEIDRNKQDKPKSRLKDLIAAICEFYLSFSDDGTTQGPAGHAEFERIKENAKSAKDDNLRSLYNELVSHLSQPAIHQNVRDKWVLSSEEDKKKRMQALYAAWSVLGSSSKTANFKSMLPTNSKKGSANADAPGFGIHALTKSETNPLTWKSIEDKRLGKVMENESPDGPIQQRHGVYKLIPGSDDGASSTNGTRSYFSVTEEGFVQFVINQEALKIDYVGGVKPHQSFLEKKFMDSLKREFLGHQAILETNWKEWQSTYVEFWDPQIDGAAWQASCEVLKARYSSFEQASTDRDYVLELEKAIALEESLTAFKETEKAISEAKNKAVQTAKEKIKAIQMVSDKADGSDPKIIECHVQFKMILASAEKEDRIDELKKQLEKARAIEKSFKERQEQLKKRRDRASGINGNYEKFKSVVEMDWNDLKSLAGHFAEEKNDGEAWQQKSEKLKGDYAAFQQSFSEKDDATEEKKAAEFNRSLNDFERVSAEITAFKTGVLQKTKSKIKDMQQNLKEGSEPDGELTSSKKVLETILVQFSRPDALTLKQANELLKQASDVDKKFRDRQAFLAERKKTELALKVLNQKTSNSIAIPFGRGQESKEEQELKAMLAQKPGVETAEPGHAPAVVPQQTRIKDPGSNDPPPPEYKKDPEGSPSELQATSPPPAYPKAEFDLPLPSSPAVGVNWLGWAGIGLSVLFVGSAVALSILFGFVPFGIIATVLAVVSGAAGTFSLTRTKTLVAEKMTGAESTDPVAESTEKSNENSNISHSKDVEQKEVLEVLDEAPPPVSPIEASVIAIKQQDNNRNLSREVEEKNNTANTAEVFAVPTGVKPASSGQPALGGLLPLPPSAPPPPSGVVTDPLQAFREKAQGPGQVTKVKDAQSKGEGLQDELAKALAKRGKTPAEEIQPSSVDTEEKNNALGGAPGTAAMPRAGTSTGNKVSAQRMEGNTPLPPPLPQGSDKGAPPPPPPAPPPPPVVVQEEKGSHVKKTSGGEKKPLIKEDSKIGVMEEMKLISQQRLKAKEEGRTFSIRDATGTTNKSLGIKEKEIQPPTAAHGFTKEQLEARIKEIKEKKNAKQPPVNNTGSNTPMYEEKKDAEQPPVNNTVSNTPMYEENKGRAGQIQEAAKYDDIPALKRMNLTEEEMKSLPGKTLLIMRLSRVADSIYKYKRESDEENDENTDSDFDDDNPTKNTQKPQ